MCTQACAVGVDSVHQTGANIALTLHCGRRAWVDWQIARVGLKASHLWRLSRLASAPRGSEGAANTLYDVSKAQMEHTAGFWRNFGAMQHAIMEFSGQQAWSLSDCQYWQDSELSQQHAWVHAMHVLLYTVPTQPHPYESCNDQAPVLRPSNTTSSQTASLSRKRLPQFKSSSV